ncbi:glycosyltransferase family 4 protein [Flavobacterium caeni]|uniref:Glycosyl transferases group 1 n=1 Tax=Flavobacterium caeni TaxID=490189 RepID=A0A1G5IYG6_9FLAO|nr:glycosyltransferase family 4 protein [Flavobacterium caeni]SCY80649.1 Glycosyl transferases group 1 [Flavobacterium caeni]
MKKVLVITYYFPPAGGPGVQRWLKFIKYLPGFGVQPHVYVPQNPTYPIVDEKLLEEIPEDAIVVKRKIFEPYGLASVFSKNKTKKISAGIIPHRKKQGIIEKLLLWIRGNCFIPDARVYWVKPSVKFLESYLEEHGIDTVITSGPPHSLHLIGLQLKEKMGVRWVADFRDPWTTIGYHDALRLSASSAQKHKEMERQVLNAADLILVTSPTTKAEFEQLTTRPIEVITNGYDVEQVAKAPLDAKFSLAHIGSFLSSRNPRILWKALRELTKENKQFAQDFELKLIGAVSQEILDTIAEFRLDRFVNNLGYVPHDVAVAHQRQSQVLLLIEIDSPQTRSIIPGKLFEYMAAERPILALGPEGSDFADILKQTNTGSFFLYDEKEALKDKILEYYTQYKNGQLRSHPVGLQQYSRKNLTEKLANLLR